MAAVIRNIVTPFFKGRLGSVVFRHIEGKVFATPRPVPSTQPPSAAQLQVFQRFREAINYAKGVMQDPVRRAIYEQVAAAKQKPVFRLAVTDFFQAPDITRVNVESYGGRMGGKIIVTALDEIGVVSVGVVIRASNGNVLEQGAAVMSGDFWTYTATTALAAGANVTVEVTAKDHAANATTASQPYRQN